MKKLSLLSALVVVFLCSAFTVFIVSDWQIKDKEYSIKFDTKMVSGTLTGLKGSIKFDENNLPASGFDVSVDVNTINTGNGMRNKHARAEGFFNAEKFPKIMFKSSSIEKTATGYQVSGALTIKGTTKNVSIPFAFDNKGAEGNFRGNFTINRTDYNLNKMMVGKIVLIELVIPVKK
jgi:polyisoprenoid-binding protein YceI